MPQARLNFADHADGSLSVQAVYIGGFTPSSPSHQNTQILARYVDMICESIQEDSDEEVEASRVSVNESSIHLTDEAGGCRLIMKCRAKTSSVAYRTCMKALRFFEFANKANSDALVTREDGLAVIVGKETINRRSGNL